MKLYKRNLICFIFVLLLLNISGQTESQQNKNRIPGNKKSEIDTLQNLRFNYFLSLGVAAGGRVGVRPPLSKRLTLEFSFGLDYRNLIALSDKNIRIAGGASYFIDNYQSVAINLLGIYQHYSVLKQLSFLHISPNISLLNLNDSGLHFFFTAGFSLEIYQVEKKVFQLKKIAPNIDVGINYNFD